MLASVILILLVGYLYLERLASDSASLFDEVADPTRQVAMAATGH